MNTSSIERSAGLALISAGVLELVVNSVLLFGTVGLYLRQSQKTGKLGAVAFAVAFCGSALLLGVEWAQLFDIRDFALRAPDTPNALNAAHGPSLSDIGGLIVLGTFTIGWLAIAAVTIWTRIPSRMAASMVVAGFFLVPILRPVLPGLLGPIVGNVVLGGGWTGLGFGLWREHATTH